MGIAYSSSLSDEMSITYAKDAGLLLDLGGAFEGEAVCALCPGFKDDDDDDDYDDENDDDDNDDD